MLNADTSVNQTISKYIKCIYCDKLHPFSPKDYIFHYEDNVLRCPEPIPKDKIVCFTCGETRKPFFIKENFKLNSPYNRCRRCEQMGNIKRYQRYNQHVKFREEMFIDAIKKCDKDNFIKYIKHNVNVNYVIQDRLTEEEKELIGCDDFKEFNNKFNTHSYDRLYNVYGKPLPHRHHYSHTHPTNPLQILIDCLEVNNDNQEKLVIYFNMMKMLLMNGANSVSAWYFFLHRYPDFDMDNEEYDVIFRSIGLIISLDYIQKMKK